MKLYNTLTRKVDDFTPADPNQVKIYTCGPTVYSHAHIGNFTAYIYWDLLIRTLRSHGWKEDRVLNITDVGHLTSDSDEGEDKLEKGARKEGKTVWQVAEYYMEDFLKNFRALGNLEPTTIARATDYIAADISLIDTLTEKGYTYETSDGIYYDTSKFPTYADFARLDLENLRAGARVDFNPEKRNPSDFALWKYIQPGEDHAMNWEYRGRSGYPGWHIECSAIIHETLGEPIDIHTGGIDHIPIHHTNEIAQSEAAFGLPLARFWLHNNFITINGAKISKSLGNIYTFEDLQKKGFTHLDYRMWVLQGHYRSERNFSLEELAAAHERLMNYRNFAALRHQNPTLYQVHGTELDHLTAQVDAEIRDALDDNLNSAKALAALDAALPEFTKNIWADPNLVSDIDRLFGLDLMNSTPDITLEQKALIAARQVAKQEKDFARADEIRQQLQQQSITLKDTPTTTIWQYT